MPRSSSEDMPAVSAVAPMAHSAAGLSATFVVAYDDVASVRYYGTAFKGFWTQKWSSIEEAIEVVSSAKAALRTCCFL